MSKVKKDDERSWKADELDKMLSVGDYWAAWQRVLLACGRVNYYRNFYEHLKVGDSLSVEKVATEYGHDLAYYEKNYRKWWRAAQVNFFALVQAAKAIGVYTEEIDKKEFLISILENPKQTEFLKRIIGKMSSQFKALPIQDVMKLCRARMAKAMIRSQNKKSSK